MNPIIEKIKKLLRMKRGGTADEIATALKLAEDLASKHGINLGDVNPDDDAPRSETMGHSEPVAGARIQCECRFAGLVCENFFKVKVFTRTLEHGWSFSRRVTRYALTFVGTEWDREIATYVFHFLVKHFRREWATKRGRCRNRQAFMWGMYLGLSQKLRERMPQTVTHGTENELVVISGQVARRDYIAKHFGKLITSTVEHDGDATQARWRGFLAGRDTEIRPGVTATGAAKLIG